MDYLAGEIAHRTSTRGLFTAAQKRCGQTQSRCCHRSQYFSLRPFTWRSSPACSVLSFQRFPSSSRVKNNYHEAIGVAGLNYISIILGFLLGGIVPGMYKPRKKHKLESRIPRMMTGAVYVATGLFIYGWTAQTRQHWILPNLGLVILTSGVTYTNAACQSYLVKTYTRHATAAMASNTIVRSIFGFSFPLFAPALYKRLGFGWGNSVLAFVALAMGVVCIGSLLVFGPKLRARSKFVID